VHTSKQVEDALIRETKYHEGFVQFFVNRHCHLIFHGVPGMPGRSFPNSWWSSLFLLTGSQHKRGQLPSYLLMDSLNKVQNRKKRGKVQKNLHQWNASRTVFLLPQNWRLKAKQIHAKCWNVVNKSYLFFKERKQLTLSLPGQSINYETIDN